MAEPLRKVKEGGTRYCRRPDVEAALDRLLAMPREEALAACRVASRSHPDHVPTECVLHLLRRAGRDNDPYHLSQLSDLLFKRVLRAFPVPERHLAGSGDTGVSAAELEVRDFAVDRLTEMLCIDFQGYDERLDMYEVMFDCALATLRTSARRSVGRHRKPLRPLSDDSEAVELSPDVEEALLRHAPSSEENIEKRDYRRKLRAAIDLLPEEDRRLLMLLEKEIPIDSKYPGEVTIARLLQRGEQTVRNRRNRIYRDLRRILEQGPDR